MSFLKARRFAGRDRYLEQINSPGAALDALPAQAKYNIARQIAQARPPEPQVHFGASRQLPAAA